MDTFIIGIAGGTGSGKTTIAQKIASMLSLDDVCLLQHDSYYRDRQDLSFEQRSSLNFDHPDALETSLMVSHLSALRAGHSIEVPSYDFAKHERKITTSTLEPKAVIIVEGILVFAEPELRAHFDLMLFVDTDADVRILRRVRRDMRERGRDFESVRKQYYETVRPMHMQFVEPSKRFADLIIPEGGRHDVALGVVRAKIEQHVEVILRRSIKPSSN